MTIPKQLEELGLSKNEAVVYLAVLELGEPGIGQVEEQTGLHKQLIYNAADQLQEQGLLSVHFVRQRRHFSVTDPSAIEKRLREKLAKARTVVSELYEVANKKRIPDQTRMYRGTKGIQQYYNQEIRRQPKDTSIRVLGVNSKRYFEIFNPAENPFQTFEEARVERKVRMELVLFGAKEEEVQANAGRKYFELRLLEGENFAPIDIVIWYDRVALLFYGADPYLLDIVGKNMVDGFHQYFLALWRQANRTDI